MKNKEEHLKWAKERAHEYLINGDATNAWTSFVSNLMAHSQLQSHSGISLGTQLILAGQLDPQDVEEMKKWIDGFN